MTLICYQGDWFRTTDDLMQGRTVMQHFDIVIEVTGDEFNVVKDRYRGQVGRKHPATDLFRVQMFALGKTLYDLPEFHKSANYGGGSELGFKDNGDLFEYPPPTRTQ